MRLVVVRPRFLSCAALVLTLAVLLVGCGGSDSESAPGADAPVRARFEELSTFRVPPDTSWKINGAFDWEAMHGFFSEQALSDATVEATRELIQIESRCYERVDGEPWQTRSPAEAENTLCHLQFLNPRSEIEYLRTGSSDWTEVGPDVVRDVETTRYTAHFRVGAINERIELWIDDTGLPHKIIRVDENGQPKGRYRVVREYFDFGSPVEVSAPSG